MEYESLILGILFSIGIFAAKSGVGLSYVISRRKNVRTKAAVLLLFLLTYGIVFAGVAYCLERVNFPAHLPGIQTFLRSGMLIHMTMAALMLVWGWILMIRSGRNKSRSRGWWVLAVPCPVCASVILFSAGFLTACFPETPGVASVGLYLAFMSVALLAMTGIALVRKATGGNPESFLGGAMILIAVYFLLSVTVMPQFADMEDVYRMARNQGGSALPEISQRVIFIVMTAAFFVGGFTYRFHKNRSLT